MTSKRGGLPGQSQGRRVLRTASENPSTNELLTVSSEFAEINRRAHEQVLLERADETQHLHYLPIKFPSFYSTEECFEERQASEARFRRSLDPLADFEVVRSSPPDDGSHSAAGSSTKSTFVHSRMSSKPTGYYKTRGKKISSSLADLISSKQHASEVKAEPPKFLRSVLEATVARSIPSPATNFRSQTVAGTVNSKLLSAKSFPSDQAIALSQALQ
eukprot:IDg6421t1